MEDTSVIPDMSEEAIEDLAYLFYVRGLTGVRPNKVSPSEYYEKPVLETAYLFDNTVLDIYYFAKFGELDPNKEGLNYPEHAS